MRDIGYYAGFLTPPQARRINSAELPALTDALEGLATDLDIDYHLRPQIFLDQPLLLTTEQNTLSDRDKLALIRGLCDRIELKLMEAAS